MKQSDLFDADAAKEAGIKKAWDGADNDWKASAAMAVFEVAKAKNTFTTDDVWAMGLETPREPRALGPVMRLAEGYGWIKATSSHILSSRKACHRRPLRVWESLVK